MIRSQVKEVTIDTSVYLQQAEEILKAWGREINRPEENRLDVQISSDDLFSSVKALMEPGCWYLSAITGLDNLKPVVPGTTPSGVQGSESELPPDTSLEVLYHFCCHAAIVTLRIKLPRTAPSIPTVCSLIPSATLYERELMELFGVEIVGTPNTDRLVLSDDWPKGVYPLRKDFTGLPKKDAAR